MSDTVDYDKLDLGIREPCEELLRMREKKIEQLQAEIAEIRDAVLRAIEVTDRRRAAAAAVSEERRRIIKQIAITGVTNTNSTQCDYMTVALCDDGTVWHLDDRTGKARWWQAPPIPQHMDRLANERHG